MAVVVYPALVTPATTGGLQARFVDLPQLVVVAPKPADLIAMARDRLAGELHRLEGRGDAWPEPSAIPLSHTREEGSVLLVDLSVDDTPIRLTISLGERLLRRIDQDADAKSMTRSGYLALGARRLLGEALGPQESGGEMGQRLQEEVASMGRRVNEVLGPDSPFGRRLADLDAVALDGLHRLGDEVRSVLKPRPKSTRAPGISTSEGPASME